MNEAVIYVIEGIRGTRVVKRRKVEAGASSPSATKEEPRVRRVVKRRVAKAVPAPVAAAPAEKPRRGRPPKPKAEKVRKPKKRGRPKKRLAYASGQNGPRIDLDMEDLNTKERIVLDALNGEGQGSRQDLSIQEIGKRAFPKEPESKANSWVRNSLRRLVRADYAERSDRGSYRVTDTGRRRHSKAA